MSNGAKCRMKENFMKFASYKENVWKLMEDMNDAFMIADEQQRILVVNSAFEEITGYQFEEVEEKTPRILKSGMTPKHVYDEMWQSLREKGTWTGELINRRKNADIYYSFMTITRIDMHDCKGCFYIAIIRDVTERKKFENKVTRLAYYDSLTELPKREKFEEFLNIEIAKKQEQNGNMALLFLDINRFKLINDSLGHHRGDVIIQLLAKRLCEALGEEAIIGRFGGDEFLILIKDLDRHIEEYVQTIFDAISKYPVNIDDQWIYLNVSMGISLFPDHTTDGQALIKYADIALTYAKDDQQNRHEYYRDTMRDGTYHEFVLGNELRRALKNEEFQVYYQLQCDVKSGEPYGVEALVRWSHPEKGNVPPGEFLSTAEAVGVIADIDEYVLQKSLQQVQQWREDGHGHLQLSVNVSQQQFERYNFMEIVADALEKSRIDPTYVTLEITETTMLTQVHYATEKLEALKELGVNIAIDDFGTGYSSLRQLQLLPIDILKIDRSFVKDSDGQDHDASMVRTIINLANNLDCQVICEGVETNEQLTFIKNENCDYAQGYLFNRPQPANDVTKRLTE
ncbi:putative bifunctional diguanylate cyclase/phosphodiesterase [Texcoconibacillus texcoconensis]|uniref:Diguanylate cyclase (GGDEF)-like protein/PAS domain S-box-containing protein n=1 Tax=Texcoconibacillus texcoconensis TaxID=1095777 RepID=A0A840QTC1_9BACI|nr:bifunctional diguanylate cyclase/phosphodiesterase [Texcoconibacillus texcoconensis]MBB5174614.1 diguanylate cyclase (GGDEF)-like protein/PAS domain S-box-containing protein [Texcoconibacillus texcoconensis]